MPRRDGEAIEYLEATLKTTGILAQICGESDKDRVNGSDRPALLWTRKKAIERYTLDSTHVRVCTFDFIIWHALTTTADERIEIEDTIHDAISAAIAAAPSWILKGPMLSGFGGYSGDQFHLAYEVT